MYSSINEVNIGTITCSAISLPFNGFWLSWELLRELIGDKPFAEFADFERFVGLWLVEIAGWWFFSSLETLIWAKTDEFGIKLDEFELDWSFRGETKNYYE